MTKWITCLHLMLFFAVASEASMNNHMKGIDSKRFCRQHSVYGQKYSIKDKTHTISYVKNFYDEHSVTNINIKTIKEYPAYFQMTIIINDQDVGDEIILNKNNGRI